MPTFKNLYVLSLLGLAVFSMSAFAQQANQKIIALPSHNSIQAVDNSTPTTVLLGAAQPTPTVKNHKNIQPTKTPKPTGTPPVIPPPADPGASNLMVGLAILSVIVILFGFWLNRQRVF